MPSRPTDVERAVRARYSEAASARKEDLCCPTVYDPQYLAVLPEEILQRDYGCGDPSRFLRRGETVLDLGSGAGKICFIASQVVGPEGRVIGVDMNDEMLALAESHRQAIGERIGHHNVAFFKGKIQDLALDRRELQTRLSAHPVTNPAELEAFEAWEAEQRSHSPMIAGETVDVIVSNCVLNLVRAEDKRRLFDEMFRVLRRGGRAVISDIVSDEEIPEALQADPELWSGCLSGAYREDRFLQAFEQAGFHGIRIVERADEPWRVVEGIEFRSLTVEAFRGKQGACLERNQAVIYKGPWHSVTDDDGHTLVRGKRMAVCDKTFRLYTQEPYTANIAAIPPRVSIPLDDARAFESGHDAERRPAETKGDGYRATRSPDAPCCGPNENG